MLKTLNKGELNFKPFVELQNSKVYKNMEKEMEQIDKLIEKVNSRKASKWQIEELRKTLRALNTENIKKMNELIKESY